MITLKQFLAELTFIKIKGISRHSKGLLLALEKSNRKEMLSYELELEPPKKCDNCGRENQGLEKYWLCPVCEENQSNL